jgi:hypothetical protein
MRRKWISRLDLFPIPKISHNNMQVFQNPKKVIKSDTLPTPSISYKGCSTCSKIVLNGLKIFFDSV